MSYIEAHAGRSSTLVPVPAPTPPDHWCCPAAHPEYVFGTAGSIVLTCPRCDRDHFRDRINLTPPPNCSSRDALPRGVSRNALSPATDAGKELPQRRLDRPDARGRFGTAARPRGVLCAGHVRFRRSNGARRSRTFIRQRLRTHRQNCSPIGRTTNRCFAPW